MPQRLSSLYPTQAPLEGDPVIPEAAESVEDSEGSRKRRRRAAQRAGTLLAQSFLTSPGRSSPASTSTDTDTDADAALQEFPECRWERKQSREAKQRKRNEEKGKQGREPPESLEHEGGVNKPQGADDSSLDLQFDVDAASWQKEGKSEGEKGESFRKTEVSSFDATDAENGQSNLDGCSLGVSGAGRCETRWTTEDPSP